MKICAYVLFLTLFIHSASTCPINSNCSSSKNLSCPLDYPVKCNGQTLIPSCEPDEYDICSLDANRDLSECMVGRETCGFLKFWDDCPLPCSTCPGSGEYLIGCCLTEKINLTFCQVYCEDHPKCVNQDKADGGNHFFIGAVILMLVVVVLFIWYAERKRMAKERNLHENWLAKKKFNDGVADMSRFFLNRS